MNDTLVSQCQDRSCKPEWRHLELGAANYDLESDGCYANEKQHTLLFRTIDEKIASLGPKGILYLNDLDEKGLNRAALSAEKYIKNKHPCCRIAVRTILGSYYNCPLPQERLNSIHLKNPERYVLESFLYNHEERIRRLTDMTDQFLINTAYFKEISAVWGLEFKHVGSDRYVYLKVDGTSLDLSYRLFQVVKSRVGYEQRFKAEEDQIPRVRFELLSMQKEFQEKWKSIKKEAKFKLLLAFSRKQTRDKFKDLEGRSFDSLYVKKDQSLLKEIEDYKFDLFVFEKHLKNDFFIMNKPICKVSLMDFDNVNFLSLKRNISSKTAVELWERLGLGNAYQATFSSDQEFWNSEKSLIEIYNQLLDVDRDFLELSDEIEIAGFCRVL